MDAWILRRVPGELHAHNEMVIADGAITSARIAYDPGELMSQLGLAEFDILSW